MDYQTIAVHPFLVVFEFDKTNKYTAVWLSV